MADEQPAGATPAEQGATPETPETSTTAATAEEAPLGAEGIAALRREREQREAAERANRKLAAELKAYQDKDKTESERNAERIAELERTNSELVAKRREDALRLAASAEARKLGFRNPDIAHRLVAGTVEFDDSGTPKNLDRLLADIAKSEPYLVNGTTDFGGGPRGSAPATGQNMNDAIRRAAGR